MGIGVFGFSDHAPIDEEHRAGITMSPEEMETYISMIQEVMTDNTEIAVRLGLEVDYPFFDSLDKSYLTDPRFDYIIGSCHFIDSWPFDHPDYADEFSTRELTSVYARYYTILKEMVSTGFFNIVGHLDLVKKFGHRLDNPVTPELIQLGQTMAEYDVAYEINTSGKFKPVGEIYPSQEIVDHFFQLNVPVTIGSDAHAPEEVGRAHPEALAMLKKAGYRKISTFEKKKRTDIPIHE